MIAVIRNVSLPCGKNDRFFEERKVTFTPKIAAALLKSGKVNVKSSSIPKRRARPTTELSYWLIQSGNTSITGWSFRRKNN